MGALDFGLLKSRNQFLDYISKNELLHGHEAHKISAQLHLRLRTLRATGMRGPKNQNEKLRETMKSPLEIYEGVSTYYLEG